MATCSEKLVSSYFLQLDKPAFERYKQKIAYIGDVDPYAINQKRLSDDLSVLPAITYPDIVNYLIYQPSPYSLEDLRCYKGLQAYNQFVSGWVRSVSAAEINGKRLITGRVMHSQRPGATPLKPWLIAESSGKVLAGHCDCMAGLGETCTHVSALLFCVETKVRIRDSRTVTQEAAYWKLPTAVKDITYLPVAEIDFTSAKTKKKQLDELVGTVVETPNSKRQQKSVEIPEPSASDLSTLFNKLNTRGTKSALLSIVPEHCHSFKPALLSGDYATVLTDLYSPECTQLPFHELLNKCDSVSVTLTQDQAVAVEKATRSQSSNKLWFRFRAGRITASKMKGVCRTNADQPVLSLVRAICYPEYNSFKNDATKWGCTHEETARQSYAETMAASHENFQIVQSGLVLNPNYPHMGASPDGLVSCDCCGEGVVEIKCPYCARASTIEEYTASSRRTCLGGDPDSISLKKDHEYMYQVQTQIYIQGVDYADFVLWTEEDLHTERMLPDETLWNEIKDKSEIFFHKVVLPELVGKFYTRSIASPLPDHVQPLPQTATTSQVSAACQADAFCYCGQPEDIDDMIACDDKKCKITWFHLGCLKIKTIPKGKWFCPECRKLPRNRKSKSKKS